MNSDDELIKAIKTLQREIIDRKWAEKKAKDALDYAESILDSMQTPIVVIDEEAKIISCNMPYLILFSLALKDVIGKNILQSAEQIGQMKEFQDIVSSDLPGSKTIEIDHEFKILGRKVIKIKVVNLQYNVKHLMFRLIMFDDLTDERLAQDQLKEALLEKNRLLKELNHRVRNNLQVLESLCNIQISLTSNDAEINNLIVNRNRISTISMIHQYAYANNSIEDISVENIFDDVVRNNSISHPQRYTVEKDIDPVCLSINQAVNFGLALNEMVANIFEHAFVDDNNNLIKVKFHRASGLLKCSLSDNGRGFDSIDSTRTLGHTLIQNIVEGNLAGKWYFENSGGITHVFEFPIE